MHHKPESLRLFYALWPDDATRAELMRVQSLFRGRQIPYENLHLTLAFLGQQPAASLPVLKEILAHLPPESITLTLDRAGYFNRHRIAWAGMHEAPDALLALQRDLAQALARRDIRFDSQAKFKPHVTLMRDAAPPPDAAFTPFTWHADQVALVQSVTRPEGAVYQVLAARRLDRNARTPDECGPGVEAE